uniref:ASD2 domain-containing protein n=1 Tax=Monopterus albus TaxID=43700 RepID=A0A3Q3IR13_MONAL|nr:protein Shroom2-like isoform X2 [Monopterus albus]XP_020447670.1 protein Shroom2-like isoform X2 [Monopterus albus]
MVNVVLPLTMPSETEVHVARSFLTKVLRSSMRKNHCRGKNDLGARPPSMLTEEAPEVGGKEATPAPVRLPKHETRSKATSTPEDQNPWHQLSLVNSMERLEPHPRPYPPARLTPASYINSTEPLCGPGGKRDSGFGCFSSSYSPSVHDRSSLGRKGTSSENIFFKGLQSERPKCLGSGGWEGSRAEEQPASWVSVAGRPSFGPVWQVPEKKSQSPPPPLRSDSFAVTKVFSYSDGPGPTRSRGRSAEKLTEHNAQNGLRAHLEKASEARCIFNPLPTKDLLHPNMAADHNLLHSNKLFSLSSSDVRQSHYAQLPAHQRQVSDESPFYMHTSSAPPSKTQSVGSCYHSLQDLLTNAFGQKQVRHSTASAATCATNPHLEDGQHNRYYSLADKHSVQTPEWQGKAEKPHWINSNEPGFPSSLKTNVKVKFPLPQSQTPNNENQERSGHDQQTSELAGQNHSPEERLSNNMKRHFPVQSSDNKVSLSRLQDPWVPQEDYRISPLRTPLLHSLAQESLAERQAAATTGVASTHDTSDSMASGGGKVNRRSDRYSTVLRKEIQQKREQLQKSRSTATLSCDFEDQEAEEWSAMEASASSGVSFSTTYKDHLKEAQARVLQATSFQRRDLEPLRPETPLVKTSNGCIRGPKRFLQANSTRSFSEPDKIDKVGVEGEPQAGSFGERRKFFEARPAFSRPVLKPSQDTKSNTDLGQTGKPKERTPTGGHEEAPPSTEPSHLHPGNKQVSVEQQRLGTFAEYQATWDKQSKLSEAKTQGRYYSAENILDTDAEQTATCVHERSRSSPSADVCAQNFPSLWRDPRAQQSGYTTRGKAEGRQCYQPDHSPHSAPIPGLPDHRTQPDPAGPSHTTISGPLSPGSQHPAQPAQTQGLLPPPRPHLGPETTSSSQELFSGAQAELTVPQRPSSSSSDIQQQAPALSFSPGPTLASSPHLRRTSIANVSTGGEEKEQEKEQLLRPSSFSSAFSPWTAALSVPVADPPRSPSPHFIPLRLTDKPPVVPLQDDLRLRSDNGSQRAQLMDVNSLVRKVPVRIVHTESTSHREGRAHLHQNPKACGALKPLPYISSQAAMEPPPLSLFSAYTCQTPQDPAPEFSTAGTQCSKEEELVRDIMGRDKSLVEVLDQSGRKTTMDLMEGLFPPEEQILEGAHQRRRASASSRLPTSSPRSDDRREDEDVSALAAASLVPSSSYYNTSAPKAELLIKMKDMQEQLEEQDSEDELDVDLAFKKQELISSLARKLEVLREAQQSLQKDVEDNEALGHEVEATVQHLCQPNQLDKFRMFVGDLDKVVSLLLSLSGRLARVENALNSLEDEAPPEEKRTLTEKRKLLMRQHEDAKELKENLDRRERLVSSIMEAHLDAESLDDYRHFVKMKSALIIEQRKLDDKIKLGEEQLKCLVDSLPLEQRPPLRGCFTQEAGGI